MKALYLSGNKIIFGKAPEPVTGPGESLVRVKLAGICRTDLELAGGYMGFSGILGHEFVGTVEESTEPALMGKRVVGEINCACMGCSLCLSGNYRHCPERTVIGILGRNGSMAEKLSIPDRNLWVVPDGVTDKSAVLTEPLAAALRLVEQGLHSGVHRAAVLGDGKLGLLVSMILAERVPELSVFGRHKRKLALLEDHGIKTFLTEEYVKDSESFDLVIEATGSSEGLQEAIDLCKPCGTIALKSTSRLPTEADLAQVVVKELRIMGSRCGPFGPALAFLKSGKANIERMVDKTFKLTDGEKAFGAASRRGIMKVLLECS